MASHFSTIGFPVKNGQDMYDLANNIADNTDLIAVSGGRQYFRWVSACGAEIWLQQIPQGIPAQGAWVGANKIKISV